MSVKNQHTAYSAFTTIWKRMRDVVMGQDAIHAAATIYLPKLREQTTEDYAAYLMRAGFYNATARTIAGLLGMLFRKDPQVTASDAMNVMFEDVSLKNIPLAAFAYDVCSEVMETGRAGILVDFPEKRNDIVTASDADKANMRPTLQCYCAEAIINWREETINNKTALTLVVLTEQALLKIDPDTGKPFVDPVTGQPDEFISKYETRYRVLDIDLNFGNVYRVRVFRINKKTGFDELLSQIYPTNNGKLFTFIPFYIVGVEGTKAEVEEPPMLDLADLNLSHYRTNADYEHGCHLTGLPMPYGTGIPETIDPVTGVARSAAFYLGSEKAFVTSAKDAKLGFMEFTGQGLGALKENLDRKEQQMSILGARMIAEEKKQAETATTTAIHRTGENSVLSSIAIAVSKAIEDALKVFAEWANDTGDIEFKINREFSPVTIDAPTLVALVGAWQAGAMPLETILDLLQRADMEDAQTTLADYLKAIADNPPPPPPVPPVDPNKIDPATGKPFEKPVAPPKPGATG